MHQIKNNPEIIKKRTFTCVDCGYSAQVYGGHYFDWRDNSQL